MSRYESDEDLPAIPQERREIGSLDAVGLANHLAFRTAYELFCDKWGSFEPLHGPISPDFEGIEWAIIGAESRNRVGRIIPRPAWIASLVSRIPRPIPVFMKENLRPHIPADWNLVQQFPEAWP